jgi:ubiquinone/menaquinone biosynthesis C-methylase UbiE
MKMEQRQDAPQQDKRAEIQIGGLVNGQGWDEWLDDPKTYRVKRAHLELLHAIPSKGRLILDAGCGPGTYGIILAEEGNDVVAIDISPEEVRRARSRGKQKQLRFSPQVADLERLPFKDNTFEVCFSGWVLHHFPNTNSAVSELYRVLKPGGLLALAEPNDSNTVAKLSRFVEDLPLLRRWVLAAGWDTPNRVSHSHHDYVASLREQGFADIKISPCFPGSLPPLPSRPAKWSTMLLLHFLFRCRSCMFVASSKLLPRRMGGTDLLITATKREQWSISIAAAGLDRSIEGERGQR